MKTPTCCGPVIENWALNKKFFVCTECKREVENLSPSSAVWTTYPSCPTPLSVEIVKSLEEQFELFAPWIDGETLSNPTETKEDPENGQKD